MGLRLGREIRDAADTRDFVTPVLSRLFFALMDDLALVDMGVEVEALGRPAFLVVEVEVRGRGGLKGFGGICALNSLFFWFDSSRVQDRGVDRSFYSLVEVTRCEMNVD
jgi:hypothetical protein